MPATVLYRRLYGGGEPLLLDSVSTIQIAAAYSIARRLTTAYTGPLIRLRRDSDNAESDFGYNALNNLNETAITTWLAGATGFVVTRYDQSGNANHATQATAGSQHTYVTNIKNGRPAALGDGTADLQGAPDATSLDLTTITVLIVGASTGAGTGNRIMLLKNGNTGADQAAYALLEATNGSIRLGLNVGGWADRAISSAGLLVDNTWYLYGGDFDGATANTRLSGVVQGTESLSGTISNKAGALQVGGYNASFSAAEYFKGYQAEIVLCSYLSNSTRVVLERNMKSYYAI